MPDTSAKTSERYYSPPRRCKRDYFCRFGNSHPNVPSAHLLVRLLDTHPEIFLWDGEWIPLRCSDGTQKKICAIKAMSFQPMDYVFAGIAFVGGFYLLAVSSQKCNRDLPKAGPALARSASICVFTYLWIKILSDHSWNVAHLSSSGFVILGKLRDIVGGMGAAFSVAILIERVEWRRKTRSAK